LPKSICASCGVHRAALLSARHEELENDGSEKPEMSDAVTLNAMAALHAHDAHLLAIPAACVC